MIKMRQGAYLVFAFFSSVVPLTQQPPAKAGGLVLRTESPDTGQRPVYSSALKLSSILGSK